MLTTNLSTPSQRYYRSVKYKITNASTQNATTSHLVSVKTNRAFSSVRKHHPRTNISSQTAPINPESTEEAFNVELKKPYL